MELKLQGKVALVPGASRGLGYAIAHRLAAEGASISIAARGSEIVEVADRIQYETGSEAFSWCADVTDPQDIAAWVDATVARFGGIDLLCVNSGGPAPGGFCDLDDQAWTSAFELLLLSAIRLIRCVLPSMKARGGGSILLLTSSAVKEPIPNLTLSNVIRGSVSALSKSLAIELASEGIRVNQLVPGRILTQRVRNMDVVNAERAAISVEEQQSRSISTIPMRRYGDPSEFAAAAAFMLSDAASYITGATLQVDGGMIRCVV
jgi:3-oxoacyl-[acyl-carrier protein] reductase